MSSPWVNSTEVSRLNRDYGLKIGEIVETYKEGQPRHMLLYKGGGGAYENRWNKGVIKFDRNMDFVWFGKCQVRVNREETRYGHTPLPVDKIIQRAESKLSSQNLRKCPIVYRPEYNTNLCGLPHPFDGYKWGKVYQQLCDRFPTLVDSSHKPEEVTQDQLLLAHSRAYLSSLKDPRKAAKALELPIAQLTPQLAATMESDVLLPMRFQAGGTVLAAELAVNNRSWAINIGGGFHHASGKKGGSGFCVYADITVALQNLFRQGKIRHAMIVDLDAHQGNGHEHDFKGDNRVYVFDMFNDKIFPHDEEAFETIRYRWHVRLDNGTGDNVYLNKLRSGLNAALADSPKCDLIIYNAGTDLLAGDHLGRLNVSYEAVINRDEFVFQTARERQIPIVMVTSGGYTAQSGKLIAESILNLHNKGLIQLF